MGRDGGVLGLDKSWKLIPNTSYGVVEVRALNFVSPQKQEISHQIEMKF